MSIGASNDSEDGPGPWWNARLLAVWILVSAAACVVGGVVLELLASDTTRELAGDHWAVAVLLVALVGPAFHGFVLGRWQWRILVTRLPGLNRRRWVIATTARRRLPRRAAMGTASMGQGRSPRHSGTATERSGGS